MADPLSIDGSHIEAWLSAPRYKRYLEIAENDIGNRSVPIMKLYYKVAIADDGSGNPSYPSSGLRPVAPERNVG